MSPSPTRRPAGFGAVLGVAEFRALWAGGLVSRVGDQLARVALALLVFDRSGSPFLTALTYALTMLPALLGGPLLGGLADRYPRRGLMVACNLARAALAALTAVPGIPFAALCALVFALQLLESPERSARSALIPELLPRDLYPAGVALNQITNQTTQLAGFAAGGAVVAATGPSLALAANAATFAGCALLTHLGVRARPAPHRLSPKSSQEPPGTTGAAAGLRRIVGTPRLRCLLALALLAGFVVVPEALAVPYAAEGGMSPSAVGLLLAAIPAGNIAGMLLLNRLLGPDAQLAAVGPLALLAGVPLVASIMRPGAVVSVALWALSGAACAYQVTANAEFARATPDHQRGQVLGLAIAALTAVQGAGMLLGGVLAEHLGPANTIALAGAGCVATSLPLAAAWRRARTG